MPRRPEKNQVARRGSAMRMRRRVGRIVVRARGRPRPPRSARPAARLLPIRVTSSLPRSFGATASGEFSKNSRAISRPGARFLASSCEEPHIRAASFVALVHSFTSASTSSACPSGVTLGKMWMQLLVRPNQNVVRSMPQTFFPYMFFSFNTPN